MGPATDKHQAPTHRLKLYVRAVIESEAIWVVKSYNIGTFQKNITAEVKWYHMVTTFYHMLPKNPLIHLQGAALINLYLVRHALAPMTCWPLSHWQNVGQYECLWDVSLFLNEGLLQLLLVMPSFWLPHWFISFYKYSMTLMSGDFRHGSRWLFCCCTSACLWFSFENWRHYVILWLLLMVLYFYFLWFEFIIESIENKFMPGMFHAYSQF